MKREVVIELKLEDQGAVNRLGKLEIETKRYQQELRALNAEILKNGEATAQQTSRVGELNARIRNNQGQIRELKNDLSGLTDAGLRFRDKMAQAFGQTLKPLFDNLNNSLAKTQGEMAQALKTFGAESIQFQKAAESVERLEKGMTELKQAQDQASAAIVKFGENSKEFKEANERLKGLETTAQELALQVAEHVEPKFVALNRQLREARREAQEAAEKFGFMSQEFQAAANKADDLEDQMKAVNATVQAIDTEGKIETFGNALQGVTGAFSLAQGAAALFGSESQKVEKALLKVQAAIAIQQGVSGLIEGTKAARALAMSVGLIGPAAQIGSAGINGMKAALISSGIGAAVVLIGTLAASMLELADNTEKARIAEEGRQKAAAKMADLKLAEISAEEELALLQGKRTQLEVDKARATRESLKSVEEERKALAESEAKYKEQITLLKELEAQNNKVNEPQILFLREQTKALEGTIKSNRAIISQSEENLAKTFQILDLREKDGKAQDEVTQGTEKGTGAIKDQTKAVKELSEAQKEMALLASQDATPMQVIGAGTTSATPADPLQPEIDRVDRLLELYQVEQDAFEQLQDAKMLAMGAFANTVGQLAQEGSAAAQVFLAIEKAASVANVIIQTQRAIATAQAQAISIPPIIPPGIPNPAFAVAQSIAAAQIARAKVTAATSIAMIVGQSIQGFAEGGVVQQADGPRYTANRGDSVLISAAPGEVVLTRDQQLRLRALAGHRIFNDIGVPGFASGGLVRGTALANMPRTPSSGAVANAELSRAINSIDMSPVVRVTEIMDVMRSVQVAQSAASL